jgi:hypothetical protein
MRKAEIVKAVKEQERKAALLGCVFAVPMSEALSAAGVRRATYIRWLQEDPEFRDAVQEAKQLQIDEIEVAAIAMAKSRCDGAMTRFMLQSQRAKEYPPAGSALTVDAAAEQGIKVTIRSVLDRE